MTQHQDALETSEAPADDAREHDDADASGRLHANREPYPGLRPFKSKESDIFFGRDDQKITMLRSLKASRFLAVVGASGCGKSSLVYAGLIPSLHAGFMGVPEGSRWQIAVIRPGNRPIERLATALVEQAGLAPDVRPALAIGSVCARLSAGPLGLIEVVHDMPLQDRYNLLIVADQFEEIFRYRNNQDEKHSHEANLFVALLLEAARQRSLPIFIVLTMRSDFIGNCAVFDGLPEAVSSSQYLTPRLTYDQLKLAILGPARVCGGGVDERLVARLLNEIGDDPNRLPVLQHALMRMWTLKPADRHVLTLVDYEQERVQGLDNALSLHADEAYESLDDRQKTIAEVMFRRLCEATNYTRRPTKAGVIAELAGATVEEVAAVADAFRTADTNFVSPDINTPIDGETKLDISHESLIKEWKTLQGWVEREARAAESYRLYCQLARDWPDGSSLLTKVSLHQAVKWRDETKPSEVWAERYAPGSAAPDSAAEDADEPGGSGEAPEETPFARTMRFIAESEAAAERERTAREEDIRTREAERTERENETKRQLEVTHQLNSDLESERKKTRKQLRLTQKVCAGFAVSLLVTVAFGAWAFTAQRGIAKAQASAVAGQVGRFLDEGNVRLGVIAASGALLPPSIDALLREPFESESWAALTNFIVGPQEDAVVALERAISRPVPRMLRDSDKDAPPLISLAASPTAPILVTATKGKVLAWNPRTGMPVEPPRTEEPAGVEAIRYSRDGSYLAAINDNDDILLWASGSFKQPIARSDMPPSAANSGARGRPVGRSIAMADVHGEANTYRIVSASYASDPTVRSWKRGSDIKSEPALETPKQGTSRVDEACLSRTGTTSVDLSSDGRLVATGAFDGCLRVWDAKSGNLLFWIKGHDRPIRSVRFSPVSPGQLVTASDDHYVGIWTFRADSPDERPDLRMLVGHEKEVVSATFDPERTRIASASLDGTVRLWDVASQTLLEVLPGPARVAGRFAHVAFSQDGGQVAASFSDERTFVWDLAATPVKPSLLPVSDVHDGTFDPRTRIFATSSANGIRLWSVGNVDRNSRPVRTIPHKSAGVVAFHPSGHEFLTAGKTAVEIWNATVWPADPAREEPDRTIGQHDQPVTWASYALGDKRIWMIDQPVTWASYAFGGKLIVTASGDSLRLFYARSGAEFQPALKHERPIVRAVIAADGQHVATLTDDRSLHLWNLATGSRRTTRLQDSIEKVDPRTVSLAIRAGKGGTQVHMLLLPPNPEVLEGHHTWVWNGEAGVRPGPSKAWPISGKHGLRLHGDGGIELVCLRTDEVLTQFAPPRRDDPVSAIITSPGSDYLGVVFGGRTVRVAWLPSDAPDRPIRYAREYLLPTLPSVSETEKQNNPGVRWPGSGAYLGAR